MLSHHEQTNYHSKSFKMIFHKRAVVKFALRETKRFRAYESLNHFIILTALPPNIEPNENQIGEYQIYLKLTDLND